LVTLKTESSTTPLDINGNNNNNNNNNNDNNNNNKIDTLTEKNENDENPGKSERAGNETYENKRTRVY
jgi:hypothetical protein